MQSITTSDLGQTDDFTAYFHVVCNQFIYRFGRYTIFTVERFNLDKKINGMGRWDILQPLDRSPILQASKNGSIFLNFSNVNNSVKKIQYNDNGQEIITDIHVDHNASILVVDRLQELVFYSKENRVYIKSDTTRVLTAALNHSFDLRDCIAYDGTLYWFSLETEERNLFLHSLTDGGIYKTKDTGTKCSSTTSARGLARMIVPSRNMLYFINYWHLLVIHPENLSCSRVLLQEPYRRLVGGSPSGGLIVIAKRGQRNVLVHLDLNSSSPQAPHVMKANTRMKHAVSLQQGLHGQGHSPQYPNYGQAPYTPGPMKSKLSEASQTNVISENKRLEIENEELREKLNAMSAKFHSIRKLVLEMQAI